MHSFIERTLQGAGKIAMRFFGNNMSRRIKDANPHSVVTEADLECERFINEQITTNYPEHGIIAEESGAIQEGAEFIWYVDPIDGTRNFETRVPLFGISLALAHNNVITHGGIYLPATNELVYAERGKGARLNGRAIACSHKEGFWGSIGIGMVSAKPTSIAFLQALQVLAENTAWVTSMGCVVQSVVYVADGRRDYYFTPNPNSWDLAAGSLILHEAGCVVTDLSGEEWRPGRKGLIATNKYLHPKLVEIAKKVFSDSGK